MIIKKRFLSLALLATGIFAVSCNKTVTTESLSPSEGLPGEVCVVAHEDILEQVKETFGTSFSVYDSTLLIAEKANERKYESIFSFWYTRHQAHEGNEKKAETIIVVDADKSAGNWSKDLQIMKAAEAMDLGKNATLNIYKNIWAQPQTVAVIKIKSITDLKNVLQTHGQKISDIVYKYSISAGLNGTSAGNSYSDSVSKVIQNNYGFSFSFPPQFRLEQSNSELIWLWQETSTFYRHLFINIFSDSLPVNSLESAVANRDYFSERYIRNTEGTSTKVSRSELFPLRWEMNKKIGKYDVHVLRGWYTEDGTYRRGPFVRYFFHDKAAKRYIALDGFVYAPEMARLPFYRGFDIIAGTFSMQP